MRRQETALKMRDAVGAIVANSQRTFRANVVNLDPLRLELLHATEGEPLLEIDDDFDITKGLTALTASSPLVVGDTVLLHRHDGHYAAFDALTDTPPAPAGGGGFAKTFVATGNDVITHNLGTFDVIAQSHQVDGSHRTEGFYGAYYVVDTADRVVLHDLPAGGSWRTLILPVG